MLGAAPAVFEDKESAALFEAFCLDPDALDKDLNIPQPVDKEDTSLAQPTNKAAPKSHPYPSPPSPLSTPVDQLGPVIARENASVPVIPSTSSQPAPTHTPQIMHQKIREPSSTSSYPAPMHPPQSVPRQLPVYSNPAPMHPPQRVPQQMPVYGHQSTSCSRLPFSICRTSCDETMRKILQLLEYHHKYCPQHNPMFQNIPNGYTSSTHASPQVNVHGTKPHQHQQTSKWMTRPAPPGPVPSSSAPAIPKPSSSTPALPRAQLKPAQKVYEFVEPTVPANFYANPDNRPRWRIEKGKRTFTGAGKGKKPEYSEKAQTQIFDKLNAKL